MKLAKILENVTDAVAGIAAAREAAEHVSVDPLIRARAINRSISQALDTIEAARHMGDYDTGADTLADAQSDVEDLASALADLEDDLV